MSTLSTAQQKEFAALDVIKALEIYDALMDLPDLTRCLISDVALIHLQQSVTMAPKRGDLTLSFAHGTIVNETPGGFSWHPPAGIEYRGAGNESVLVEISEVQAEKY